MSFGIYKKGFETKGKRDKELKKYEKKKTDILPPLPGSIPSFSYDFSSSGHRETVNGLNAKVITAEEFREKPDYNKYMYVLYKTKEDKYFKWRVFNRTEDR
ncbi:hypothetical protein CHU92_11915 [Flavobacterium cyanobacteriorum]|uniref:Uncharacterized protein n=2 Tax=Flavobacterium cyanobacteriorum TaxID=2022802 RepID=A0A255Z132_9FLAO|nr:hypothetical protein CHU92_11915 [Flavobacterium cyanobacteriorum]